MSTLKAQKQSENLRNVVTQEVRKRKYWAVVAPSVLDDYGNEQQKLGVFEGDVIPAREVLVRRLFGTRLDAPVVASKDGMLIAVWRREGEPTEEPGFVTDPTGKPIAFAVVPTEPLPFWKRMLGMGRKPAELPAPEVQKGPVSLERGGFGMDEEP